MFKEERCDFCGECLERCLYMDFSREEGAREFEKLVRGEKVDWLYDCVTCFACNEFCPTGARPFDLILQRLEEDGGFADRELLQQMAERFDAKSEPRPVEIEGRVMSLCVMKNNMPWAIEGALFENLTLLRGLPYFCNILFAHMGSESLIRDRVQRTVDNLARSGAEEIIFIHEDCYALLNDIAPEYGVEVPFRVVHLFEYLRDFLQENRRRIQPLNLKVAYQRPCASRHTPPEVEAVLNELLTLTGAERVDRQYDGLDALCCGAEVAGPGLKLFPRGKNFAPFREKNIADAVQSGAEAVVYLCPMCFQVLQPMAAEAGLQNFMVSDLCRLSLGETLPEEKPR